MLVEDVPSELDRIPDDDPWRGNWRRGGVDYECTGTVEGFIWSRRLGRCIFGVGGHNGDYMPAVRGSAGDDARGE